MEKQEFLTKIKNRLSKILDGFVFSTDYSDEQKSNIADMYLTSFGINKGEHYESATLDENGKVVIYPLIKNKN